LILGIEKSMLRVDKNILYYNNQSLYAFCLTHHYIPFIIHLLKECLNLIIRDLKIAVGHRLCAQQI
jgi:hypothetical protein